MRYRLLTFFVAATALLGALSSPADATITPYAQMKNVIADINKESSARVVATLTKSGKHLVNTTDATRVGGYQTIVLTNADTSNTVIIELVDGGLFVKGDESILIAYMGFPKATAKQLSDQWFTIPRNNSDYAEVAQGLTLSSVATELTMNKTVTANVHTGLSGFEALKGTSVKTALEPSAAETLYFLPARDPLPSRAQQTYQGSTSLIVFSHWNETVRLVVPRAKFQLT